MYHNICWSGKTNYPVLNSSKVVRKTTVLESKVFWGEKKKSKYGFRYLYYLRKKKT